MLITVRYSLPFHLEAEPLHGVVQVVKDHNGLVQGDVLRAFSTPELRYDSASQETRFAGGFRGTHKFAGNRSDDQDDASFWMRFLRLLRNAQAGLGINPELLPTKVLFLADGQPYQRVRDALCANTLDKTNEIVMIFERPLLH
mmetsp:Transcript_65682/g.109129  ORF Transcript_65682/g.109129 Transcript_65682/m.109129 type:complete len:143 (+) Transcript_65682:3-431(+)